MSRWKLTGVGLAASAAITCWVAVFFGTSALAAQTSRESRPARELSMAVEYPGIELAPGESVNMDVIFYNRGRSNEDVQVWIEETPEGWSASLETFQYSVSAVHVPSAETKTLTFEAEPGADVAAGDYRFVVASRTPDGKFSSQRAIQVTVSEKPAAAGDRRAVNLTTSYPVLRGPSDAEFEFSIEVESDLNEDAVFDLFAQAPEGWEVNFKPAYESKFISSLRLKANQSSTVAVQVKPAPRAETGSHPIQVRVSAGKTEARAELTVILTGTYSLEVGTASGLLSLDAQRGRTANLTMYVKNTGTAENSDIEFMAFKPENWTVEFEPASLAVLKPGELKQVEVRINPYEDALVGDYSISVRTDGERVSETTELRVTVKASAAWSWIGILIIVLVIAGLSLLFRKLGRR